jgi:hypothetical protein
VRLPIRDSYRVADRFLAGKYPGSPDVDEAARRLRRFQGHGVTLYVDLTHPADSLPPYADLVVPGARRSAQAIVDMGVPTIPHMSRIMDEVDEELATGGTVYVHCWGGIGRTGTVVGCWLRRHGLDRGDALARLAELRHEVSGGSVPSPETPAQRAMVEAWKPGR